MWKQVFKVAPEYIENLVDNCLREGYFPVKWKIAKVTVLLKSPSSYRGICLIPALGKVFERLLVERLQEAEGHRLCLRQFGFRAGKCVEDAWAHAKRRVEESTSKYILEMSVDFKAAFDHLEWPNILGRLEELGCRELALCRSYFTNQQAVVVGTNEEVRVDVVRGCPQDSIAGPLLWNIMIDPLLHSLSNRCGFSAFADDLLLLVEGQSRACLERKGSGIMAVVEAWGNEVVVEVNVAKTCIMMLRGNFSPNRRPIVKFRGPRLYTSIASNIWVLQWERS